MLWRYYDNMLSRFNRIPERYGRTDGQTDGRTENCCINTRVNLLTRDKKGSRDPNDATFGGKFLFMGYIFEACTLENIVTLKSGLALIQGRWNWYRSKAWMWFPIRIVTMTIFSRFDTIYERDRQTARQQRTTLQWSHYATSCCSRATNNKCIRRHAVSESMSIYCWAMSPLIILRCFRCVTLPCRRQHVHKL